MEAIANDPQQQAVDDAVAREVAGNPAIMTPAKAAIAESAGLFGANNLEPSERLRLARERRIAFDRAMASLRVRSRADVEPIRAAIAAADSDGVITSILAYALSLFLTENMGRPGTFLHGLNHALLDELQAAVWADAANVLASPDDDAPDGAYVRQEALAATTLNARVYDMAGRPTLQKRPPLSQMQTIVPRTGR